MISSPFVSVTFEPSRSLPEFSLFKNEPRVNVWRCCFAAKVNACFLLKANVRGRILSWSNWTLLTRFLLQSDSPDDGSGWHRAHRWGEEARPPTAAETCRRLCLYAAAQLGDISC